MISFYKFLTRHTDTIFGLIIGISLYFQGMFVFLNPELRYESFMRDPSLPLWLKLTDEFFLLVFLGQILFRYVKISDLGLYWSKSKYYVCVGLFFLISCLFKQISPLDLVGISVTKTIILFLICSIFMVCFQSKQVDRFFKTLVYVIALSLWVGIVTYFIFEYTVFGNRFIGLTLNPNFTALHGAVLLFLALGNSFNTRVGFFLILTATFTIFLTVSFTIYILLLCSVFIWLFFSLYIGQVNKKIKLKLLYALVMTVTVFVVSLLMKFEIVNVDYRDKVYTLLGLPIQEQNVAYPSPNNYKGSEVKLGQTFVVRQFVGAPNFKLKEDVSFTKDRIATAEKIVTHLKDWSNPMRLLFGVSTSYEQSDSSWGNLIYNYGLIGFALIFLAIMNLVKQSFNLKRINKIYGLFANINFSFVITFIILGSTFQQFIENWNVLILIFIMIHFVKSEKFKSLNKNPSIS